MIHCLGSVDWLRCPSTLPSPSAIAVASQIREIREEARRQRQQLVNSALSSMRQLRAHHTFAISGLREAPSALTDAEEAWRRSRLAGVLPTRPWRRRAFVQGSPRRGAESSESPNLVIKLEMPPLNALGIAPPPQLLRPMALESPRHARVHMPHAQTARSHTHTPASMRASMPRGTPADRLWPLSSMSPRPECS